MFPTYVEHKRTKEKFTILHVVDNFSRYQRAYILYDTKGNPIKNETPSDEKLAAMKLAFQKMRSDMGMPRVMFMDGDGMFNNNALLNHLKNYGVKVELSGPHAPWQTQCSLRQATSKTPVLVDCSCPMAALFLGVATP